MGASSGSALGRASLILGVGLDGLRSGLGQAVSLVKNGLVGISAAAAAGIGAAVVDSIGRIGETAKIGRTADAFGIDRGTFSGMAGVAASAGSDIRDFTESLITMSKAADDGAKGLPSAAEAFRDLGVNANEIAALKPEEKYYRLMDALAGVTDNTKRLRLASVLAGEDGAKNMIPLIGKTSAELRELGQQYGLTADQVGRSMAADRAMTALGAAVGKVRDTMAAGLAPAIQTVANWMAHGARIVGQYSWVFDTVGNVATNAMRLIKMGIDATGVSAWLNADKFEMFGQRVKASLQIVVMAIGGIATSVSRSLGLALKDMAGFLRKIGLAISALGMLKIFKNTIGQDATNMAGMSLGIAANEMTNAGNTMINNAQLVGSSIVGSIMAAGDYLRSMWGFLSRNPVAPDKAPDGGKPNPNAGQFASNKALRYGSQEEFTARLRAMNGSQSVAEKQLAEQRRASGILKDMRDTMLNRPAEKYKLQIG